MGRLSNKRVYKSYLPASAFLAVIAGALFPDVDILWQHRSWTHDWRLPLAVLCLMAVAYFGRRYYKEVLKWKR